ncbi:biotin transport system permease protein [Cryobacterium psychrotolerans]|uniref:Biotin transport system permease protein n=1 Tax=Cryobacterium psychrotolerans TaxID=386301 RepID=A0A1G9FB66_9MICO|nr:MULTISPECIES: energy-coupling factor transporter transmembrane protein EcfT [Cryobacterium]TFD43779.1 energy-coupling factor transporter transmembrane protein EcfT [Cryobacterium sp. TMT1-2-1]TFD86532.1 energy-coupling factor transporter transmembrane protein EcfT [Cryobacterium psychrotolerans]SDK85606.1 biotin transport system permease protein [Cryobacterium psychrotolerans]
MIGLYSPGRSVIHRAPTLLKLLLLSVGVVVVGVLAEPWQLAIAALVVLSLFVIARIPPRAAVAQIAPILWMLVLVVPIQGLLSGWLVAALMAGRLIVAVALAALFTLTTTVTAVLEAFHRLLRPFGRWVDADRIGLLVALTIRCIPLVTEIVTEVLEARRARGTRGSVMALAVPVVVRSLYAADALGEALVARGLDD